MKKIIKKVLPLMLALVLALGCFSTAYASTTMPQINYYSTNGGVWNVTSTYTTPEGLEPFQPSGNEWTVKVIYLPASKVSILNDALLMSNDVANSLKAYGFTKLTTSIAGQLAAQYGLSVARVNAWVSLGMYCINLGNLASHQVFKSQFVAAKNASYTGAIKYTINHVPDIGIYLGDFTTWDGITMPINIANKYAYTGWSSGSILEGNYDFFISDYGL